MTFDEWTGIVEDKELLEGWRKCWDAATAEEREACAGVCEKIEYDYYRDNKCALAIRARSNVHSDSSPKTSR